MSSKASKEEEFSNNFAKMLNFCLKESNNETHKVNCSFNENHNYFTGTRYKCLICDDYNLCGSCFETKCYNLKHKLGHPMVCLEEPNVIFGKIVHNDEINLKSFLEKYKDEIHHDVTCDCCKNSPIKGLRFKCDVCRDYDLCYECYLSKRESKSHEIKHPLVVIAVQTCLEVNAKNIDFIEKLGEGAFGAVFKSKLRPSQKIVATKVISINKLAPKNRIERLAESFVQEYNCYKEIKGVNILKMLGHSVFFNDEQLNLMIITEFMGKGSLSNLIENEPDLSLRKRLSLAVDIASGMSRIHDRSCIHRDIRPDNILISDNYTAKIGDFGITKFINIEDVPKYGKKHSMIGCIPYMPPEFYTGDYTNKLDIYTFGLTLVELFGGQHACKNFEVKVIEQPLILLDLVSICKNSDPDYRPSARYVEKYLNTMLKVINKSILEIVNDYLLKDKDEKDRVFIKIQNMIVPKLNNYLKEESNDDD